MSHPNLAVIVAAQGTAAETASCLQSLIQQTGIDSGQIEIIVVEGAPGSAATALKDRFLSEPVLFCVRFKECDSSSLPRLHAAGMLQTEADLIALTEGHCMFTPDWAASALAAHANASDIAIGGTILPGANLGLLNTGLFLCDYAQFLPPLPDRQTCDLPGNNVVFKRAGLTLSPELAEHGFWKTFHCRKLYESGSSMHNQPSMKVFYNRRLGLKEIAARRYHHGRCFGSMRAEQISIAKRAIFCLLGPLLPFLLMYRLCRRAWAKTDYRKQFISSAPAAFFCICLWVLGESLGNLFGASDCCTKL
jgi:hypothetical protein